MCKSYNLYILFSLVIFQLIGCAPVAVVSGPVTFADRRATEIQYIDQKIEIKAMLETQDIDQEDNLSFVSYNQIVLLTGEAKSQEIVKKVEDKIASLENVKEIKNFINVQPKISSLKSRAEDVLITSNVKSRLFIKENETKLFPMHVKVFTQRQEVYLMGILNQKEAEYAIKIAKSSRGVKKVIPLFEIIK